MFYIGANTVGVIMLSYYFNTHSSFIKLERVDSPETYWYLRNCTEFVPQYSNLDFNHVVLHQTVSA